MTKILGGEVFTLYCYSFSYFILSDIFFLLGNFNSDDFYFKYY